MILKVNFSTPSKLQLRCPSTPTYTEIHTPGVIGDIIKHLC